MISSEMSVLMLAYVPARSPRGDDMFAFEVQACSSRSRIAGHQVDFPRPSFLLRPERVRWQQHSGTVTWRSSAWRVSFPEGSHGRCSARSTWRSVPAGEPGPGNQWRSSINGVMLSCRVARRTGARKWLPWSATRPAHWMESLSVFIW